MAGSCCPYGPFLLLPILSSTTAFVMTWVFTFDCRFFQASFQELNNENKHASLYFGLWTVQDYYMYFDDDYNYGESPYGMCIGYDHHSSLNREDYIDGPLRFARVASMLLSLISWVLLVFLLFASCMIFSPGAMKSLAWGFGLIGLCCILCLIALATDLCKNANDCTLGRDGIICICASLIWVIAAVSVMFLRPMADKDGIHHRVGAATAGAGASTNDANRPRTHSMVPGTEEVKITETVSSDGTVSIVTRRSVYNANGTMTVTETREVRAAPPPATPVAAAVIVPDAPIEPNFHVAAAVDTPVKGLNYP